LIIEDLKGTRREAQRIKPFKFQSSIVTMNPRPAMTRRERREAFEALAFLSPWIIGFVLFIGGPIIASFFMSFYRWDPSDLDHPRQFIGMANYRELFRDEMLRKSLYNTIVYAAMYIPSSVCTALTLAVLLNQRLPGMRVFRTILYLPTITQGVATFALWRIVYDADNGPINRFLGMFVNKPARVADRSGVEQAGDRSDEPLERRRDDADLSRRAAEHPAAALRSGEHRRRRKMAAVHQHHAADALADDSVEHDHGDDRRVSGLRRRVHPHQRRAGAVDVVLRVLPLQPGVRLLQHGIRLGDGVAAVSDHPGADGTPVALCAQVGALWVIRPFDIEHPTSNIEC
jgi:hypothetical protein